MILTEKIKIKVNPAQVNHLKKYYPNIKSGDIIDVPVEHLSKGSNLKIEVKCDICGREKKLSLHDYNKNTKKYNFYSCSQECSVDKSISTNIDRYGKHPSKLKENRIKALETSISRYGENYMRCDEIKGRIIKTNIEKYGVEYPLMSENIRRKVKSTNLIKYGVENPFQVDEFKDKIKNTNLIKYGVENPQQCDIIHYKSILSGYLYKKHENGMNYQGSYEKDFIDFCISKNINIERCKSIQYEYNGKIKKYYPDFYYKDMNLIIEIKSTYTYLKDLEINEVKHNSMIELGYNFIFIIDKNYKEFISLIKNKNFHEN